MSSKWYGNLMNRIGENRDFCDEITVGTGVTEYLWSDRHAYEVIEVTDQKHVKIRTLDHKLVGECMSNDWELLSNENNPVYSLVKRGKYWYIENIFNIESVDENNIEDLICLAHHNISIEELKRKKKIKRYNRINVSFGYANYYFDYSF